MKRVWLLFVFTMISSANSAQTGDRFAAWIQTPDFKAKYTALLNKTPISGDNSWAYKDANLGLSTTFAGQTANAWIHTSTCATTTACAANHIDVFYDPKNQRLFAYLTLGNRVGWMGKPLPSEQAFFTPHLTAKSLSR